MFCATDYTTKKHFQSHKQIAKQILCDSLQPFALHPISLIFSSRQRSFFCRDF